MLDLYNIKYDRKTLKNNIYAVNLTDILKTQILDIDEKESIIITEPAKVLISKHKIDPVLINSLGLKVIKANDIIEFLNKEINNKLIPLSPRQQGISKTVTKSKSTIPSAFLLKKVYATRALSFISTFTSEKSVFLSLNEILIFTIANIFSKFPLFFSTLIDECNIRVPDNVNIGVTIDVTIIISNNAANKGVTTT